MKKLLLLSVLALGAVAANAQDFTVTYGPEATVIKNGETITSYEINALWAEDGIQIDPEITITPTVDMNISLSVTDTSTDPNAPLVQCCFPMACQTIKRGGTLNVSGLINANVPKPLQIETQMIEFYDMEGNKQDVPDAFTASCKVDITPEGAITPFTFNLIMVYDKNYDAAVEGIVADDSTPVYYNLNGVRINNPEKGIFIKRQGNKTTKVIL